MIKRIIWQVGRHFKHNSSWWAKYTGISEEDMLFGEDFKILPPPK